MRKIAEAVIRVTRAELLRLGLLNCSCGHPPNKHFEHGDRPCAACNCKELRENVSIGTVMEQKEQ